jgi:hypothetical protein
MVGQHHYESILPCFTLTEVVDKIANALIQIIERINHLIVEMVYGDIPGDVTAQRRITDQEGLFRICGHLI